MYHTYPSITTWLLHFGTISRRKIASFASKIAQTATRAMFSTVVLEGASSSSLKCDGNAVCVERERFAVDAAFEAGTEPEAILDRCGLDFDACLATVAALPGESWTR